MLMAMLGELLMAAPALVIVMVVALVVIGPTQGPRQVGYGRWGAADGGSRVVVVDQSSVRGRCPLLPSLYVDPRR